MLIVLAVLVSIALPNYAAFVEKGVVAEALVMIDQIANAEIVYHLQTGDYANQFSSGPPLNVTANWNIGYSEDSYWCYLARVDAPNTCNIYATRVNKGNPLPQFVDKRIVLNIDGDQNKTWNEGVSNHPFTPKN